MAKTRKYKGQFMPKRVIIKNPCSPKTVYLNSLWESLVDYGERALLKYCAVTDMDITEMNHIRVYLEDKTTELEVKEAQRRRPKTVSNDEPSFWDGEALMKAYGPPLYREPFDWTPYIRDIPEILRLPRQPPNLPSSIMASTFSNIICQHVEVQKLIARYESRHGKDVFNFWTEGEIALVKSGQAPQDLASSYGKRLSIPARILRLTFGHVLNATPLLSNLIDRYHKDRGLEFFGFFGPDFHDPRPKVPEDEPPEDDGRTSDAETDDDWWWYKGDEWGWHGRHFDR